MSKIDRSKDSQMPELNLDAASQILENVFKENNMEPNTIPLEVLTAYSNYRKERFSLQRLIIVIIMVLFLMVPFLFIPSKFTVTPDQEVGAANPTYTLNVTSKMPVKRITAEINGRNIPVYEIDSQVYSIEPTINGKMEIVVTLINNQVSSETIDVSQVDLKAPVMLSNNIAEDHITLYVADYDSGVDYEMIEAIDAAGNHIKPSSYNATTGEVVFPYPTSTWNVSVPDYTQNNLQLVISLQ